MSLISLLKTIPDPRSRRGRRHELWLVMFLSILGDLCGYRGYRPLATFAQDHHGSWCDLLGLDVKTVQAPSYSTFRQVFLRVEATAWVAAFNQWINHHPPANWGELCADGKSIRCTRTGDLQSGYNYANLVSVYSPQAGVVQLGLIFNKSSSEIPMARTLLGQVTENAQRSGGEPMCFSLDALHTQVKTFRQIHQQMAHYVIGLKANQKTLYQLAQTLYKQALPESQVTDDDTSRARQVRRTIAVYPAPTNLPKRWANCGITSIISVVREGTRQGKSFYEHHYYLSNRVATAETFAALIRNHWQIENGLHWVKDVTLKEDFPPRQGSQSPISWAVLNSFLVTFARRLGTRTLPQALRKLANQVHEVFRCLT